jgi:hypothetical protein
MRRRRAGSILGRLGLDDHQRIQAAGPHPVQPYPDQAIDQGQARTKQPTPADDEKLMP